MAQTRRMGKHNQRDRPTKSAEVFGPTVMGRSHRQIPSSTHTFPVSPLRQSLILSKRMHHDVDPTTENTTEWKVRLTIASSFRRLLIGLAAPRFPTDQRCATKKQSRRPQKHHK